MAGRQSEERERRIFFSWQSDTAPKANRYVIEQAVERAAKAAGATWAPSDRPTTRVETASSDLVGARQITDVLFERIRAADAFVADVSLVVAKGRRLMPNPNVLLETGYALHALSDARIVLVLNTALGSVEELPFDLRGRLALTYSMRASEAPAPARQHLSKQLTEILGRILSLPRTTQDVRIDVGVFDALAMTDMKKRETIFVVTVRNFSDFPLRLVSVAYEFDPAPDQTADGFVYPEHANLLASPIPPRDSRAFPIPIAAVRQAKAVVRISAKDSLDRTFYSEPGAVRRALEKMAECAQT